MRGLGASELIILLVLLMSLFPFWRICSKAGYSKWLSLVAIIPYAGPLFLLFFLALTKWPVQRRLEGLEPKPESAV